MSLFFNNHINKQNVHVAWHYIFFVQKTQPRFHAGLQTEKGHFWQNTVEEKQKLKQK